jgi:ABC-2 type transport system permease protein
LGAALFGLAPRAANVAWGALIACFLLLEIGPLFGVSTWLADVSPFTHIPKLPGSTMTAAPMIWLTAAAAALLAAGLTAFRRRDIG